VSVLRVYGLLLSLVLFAGCRFKEAAPECDTTAECEGDRQCYQGFCVVSDSTSTTAGRSTGKGGEGASGTVTSPSMTGGGRGGTSAPGAAGNGNGNGITPMTAGKAAPSAAGAGGNMSVMDAGTKPAADTGTPMMSTGECEANMSRDCVAPASSLATTGGCGPGKQFCDNGQWGACMPNAQAASETCNGADDDCNGKVDDIDIDCYPGGAVGCAQGLDGRYSCQGLCAVGKLACANGAPGDCTGAKTPQAEQCGADGSAAADENCDGITDENCQCTGTMPHVCYGGRALTRDVGTCHAGMQTCTNGVLGACQNEVRPALETCANQGADNDCNGTTDDIRELNATCTVATNQGPCKTGTLQCVAGNPSLQCVTPKPGTEVCNGMDDDCSGKVDDTFDLMNDRANCGACNHACATAESCCSGVCVNTNTDNNNCGACGKPKCETGLTCSAGMCGCGAIGRPCAAGELCCGTTCVNPKTDVGNCGKCGTACSGVSAACCTGTCTDLTPTNCGPTGGGSCTCAMPDAGTVPPLCTCMQ
jgi:hypothetical protein